MPQLLYEDDAEGERELDEQVVCPSCHLPTVEIGDELWCQWEKILVAEIIEPDGEIPESFGTHQHHDIG